MHPDSHIFSTISYDHFERKKLGEKGYLLFNRIQQAAIGLISWNKEAESENSRLVRKRVLRNGSEQPKQLVQTQSDNYL